MRQLFALDLKDDPGLIARYEQYHRAVWPEVLAHLRRHGVTDMTIHRLGTRLVMVMDTDDSIHDASRMAEAIVSDEAVARWEALMWEFQAPTPWTPVGTKWTPMHCIFDWRTE